MNLNGSGKLYTIEEVTEMLGVSEQEIMNMITLKKLPAVESGDSVKVREEDVETFLDNLGKPDGMDVDDESDKEDDSRKIAGQAVAEAEKSGKEYGGINGFEDDRIKVEDSYRDLLKKKQELEEDINYLQHRYDEFKSRIKKMVSEEYKSFLKEIDEDNINGNYRIQEDSFEGDMDIDNIDVDAGIDAIGESGNDSYDDDNGITFSENNGKDEEI
jgi:excisionase family DNA binding protein